MPRSKLIRFSEKYFIFCQSMVPLSEIDLMDVPTEKKVKNEAKQMMVELIQHEKTPELMKAQFVAMLPSDNNEVFEDDIDYDDLDFVPSDHFR